MFMITDGFDVFQNGLQTGENFFHLWLSVSVCHIITHQQKSTSQTQIITRQLISSQQTL